MNEWIALDVYESVPIQNAQAIERAYPQLAVTVCLQSSYVIGTQASGGIFVMIHFSLTFSQVYAVQTISFSGNPYLSVMFQKALDRFLAFE